MHDLPLLINITLALVVAFFGGVAARKLGLPTIVGYLLAGILIGPFTPGFVGDLETIQQLAELGIIFLMFGVGLHFSFQDLWRVRDIAIPGALIQTAIASLLGLGLSLSWGWSIPAGLVLGLAISVASTVVLLRGLMDHSLLNTAHGQAAIGWLVMEDILSVIILILLPAIASSTGTFHWQTLAVTLLKAAAFVLIMGFIGVRFIPWLLERIAFTRSRELFILAVLAITLGTAMGATEFFGVSLALGAFVAGAIISQSHLSHQVGADVFSLREAFSVLFFVSVGMLVNPAFLWQQLGQVIALTLLVIIGKILIVLILGMIFPRPAKTILTIAIGLSQIGEFSFILGQTGLSLKMLNENQYALILAAALLSITINPFLYKLLPSLERLLQKVPGLWRLLENNRTPAEMDTHAWVEHVVIVGYGSAGSALVNVLLALKVPILVIESDAERVQKLNQQQIPTLYGDASNSEIIQHAYLDQAHSLIITVPDETTTAMIVKSARAMNSELNLIARAATDEGASYLTEAGVDHIIQPELESGLEIMQHTLLSLGYGLNEVHQYIESIRHEHHLTQDKTKNEFRSLRDLLRATRGIEIHWMEVTANSPLIGVSLAEANVRAKTGASVVALLRDNQLIANPKSLTVFQIGDRLGIIGEKEQMQSAEKFFHAESI